MPDESLPAGGAVPRMTGLLWRLVLRPRIGGVAVVVAFSIVAAGIQVAGVGMTIPIIGTLSDSHFDLGALRLPALGRLLSALQPLDRTAKILALLGLLIGVTLLKGCASVLYKYYSMRLLLTTRFDLPKKLFARFLHADYALFLERSRGGIAHDIWWPPAQIAEVLRSGTEFLSASVQLLGLLAFMSWISWRLTALCGVLALAGFLLISRRSQAILRTLSDQTYGLQHILHAMLAEVLDGLRQVRAFAAEASVFRRFNHTMDEILGIEFRFARLRYLPAPAVELGGLLVAALLIVAVTTLPAFGLDFAFLVGFLVAFQGLHPTVSTLVQSKMGLDGLAKNLEVVDRLFREVTPEHADGREAPPAPLESLAFEGVSFAYPVGGRAAVLQDVSVEFRRGEVTAVVGASGAGKSTLADLVIRLYRPTAGVIRANGMEIQRLDLRGWRRSIGFVSQETFLFNASLRENIAFADPEAPFEAVAESARKADIHGFIQALPQGYDTVVGDRGLKLSGGQRQRVAIARALLHDPPILVFDEATSALDNESERAIQDTIESLGSGRIVIVIAHRLSTIVNADKIVVLDRGRVVEQGSHAELVGVGGRYAALYAGSEA